MPVSYLDVPTGADLETKRELVHAMYVALKEAYPFPDDTRIFIREWPPESVSQNGLLGSEPIRPAFVAHVPQGVGRDVKRIMLEKLNAAMDKAYGLPWFITFLHEHSLDVVAVDGVVLADDQQRVEDQHAAYS
ncbi:hypothetical protein E0H75_21705 [Kribbella capetownensis]|uniref:Tautomerase cis-CaaD-like domain-containing protein n=1 Tax=Kribbella capetownensis TaxID=1572659 RepID=A0A4R0JM26_9ACTN|nr:hypothetical protein [Kribbella capetownensis]TCC47407.1 hypothetical protein E0H75_21705 [Kribbella capetownensis]